MRILSLLSFCRSRRLFRLFVARRSSLRLAAIVRESAASLVLCFRASMPVPCAVHFPFHPSSLPPPFLLTPRRSIPSPELLLPRISALRRTNFSLHSASSPLRATLSSSRTRCWAQNVVSCRVVSCCIVSSPLVVAARGEAQPSMVSSPPLSAQSNNSVEGMLNPPIFPLGHAMDRLVNITSLDLSSGVIDS